MPNNELRLRMTYTEDEARTILNLGPDETIVYAFVDPMNGSLIIETRKGQIRDENGGVYGTR
jgi:hypothetical protein